MDKKMQEKKPDGKKDGFDEKAFFDFLRGRTIKEITGKFGITEEKVKKLLAQAPKGYKVYRDVNPYSDRIFCLPAETTVTEIKPKIWTYAKEINGGPAVDIFMPDDVGWKSRKDKGEERLGQDEKEKIRIVPLSDIWFAHELHDGPGFDERLAWIALNPHIFCFFNGDAIYPRFAATEDGWEEFSLAVREFRKKLLPIAHKILWAQAGCFEDRFSKTHYDPMKYLCKEWDIPYFTSALSAGIHWAGNLFTFYCVHGRSQAQKKGSKINAVLRLMGEVEFYNFFVMSHIRDAMITKPTRVKEDRKNFDLLELKQYAFICPSFVRYDGSRESKWGYPLPFRGQVNCALYRHEGDYHWYSSSLTTNIELYDSGKEEGNGDGKKKR